MLHAITQNERPSLNDRLAHSAIIFRAAAGRLAPGAEHDVLIAKAHQAEAAIEINSWLSSSELRSPT